MAARSFLYGGGKDSGDDTAGTSVLLPNKRVRNSINPDDFFFVPISSSFHGSRSMVCFEDRGNGIGGQFFQSFDQEDNGDDDYFQQPEKKRRLTVDQVRSLEKSFDSDNKLEPDRKIQLAKELGLQPRQVAIWFQNRRARWKNKQLEKEYDDLLESYDKLKANYDNLVKEKEILKSEVDELSDKLLLQEKGISDSSSTKIQNLFDPQVCQQFLDQERGAEISKTMVDDDLTMKIDVIDNGVQTSLLEHCDSSYVFEQEHSEGSLDEENTFRKLFLPSVGDYSSANIDDRGFVEPHLVDSCYLEAPGDYQVSGFWS